MPDEQTYLLKGGVVITFDRLNRSGVFDIVVKSGKISIIDHEGMISHREFMKENPGGKVIDAAGKIIMPGLFNSGMSSVHSLTRKFFEKCDYENISAFVSLNLVEKYLSDSSNFGRLSDLLELAYKRSLQHGEVFVNEIGQSIGRDIASKLYEKTGWIKQHYRFTAYDPSVAEEAGKLGVQTGAGFRADENVNSYSISSLKKTIHSSGMKLILDASLSSAAAESVRETFGKLYVSVLSDSGLLGSGSAVANPTRLTDIELELIKQKGATILIYPSDFIRFSGDVQKLRRVFESGVNVITGTGLSGNDMLSELKLLHFLLHGMKPGCEALFRTALTNPAGFFGIQNYSGSIEKNKSADLILFNVRDVRNSGGLPGLDSDSLCWHILTSISSKDITDMFVKGERVFMDSHKDEVRDSAKVAELTSLLYSAGKFREYREKKLMKGRVDKVTIGIEQDKDAPVFVDMTETGEYTGEGEFTILGKRIEEFQQPRGEEAPVLAQVQEVKSTETDLNFLEPEMIREAQPELRIRLAVKTGAGGDLHDKKAEASEPTRKEADQHEKQPPEIVPAPLKKVKLKFGFGDGE